MEKIFDTLTLHIQKKSFLCSLQEYDSDEASPTSYAEVERFQGKVVYNLDGKAYIIDSENELSLQLSDSSIKGKIKTTKLVWLVTD